MSQALNDLKNVVVNGLTRVESTLAYKNYIYLQEIPFHRWWVYTNYDAPIAETCDRWKARGWALLSLIEGSFRALISAIAMLYNRCCGNNELSARKHQWIAKEQGIGLKYALWAIWNPNGLKHEMHTKRSEYAQAPFFGYKEQIWGTRYNGNLEIDFCTVNHPWRISQNYPWQSE
jgi:hypothetical protein